VRTRLMMRLAAAGAVLMSGALLLGMSPAGAVTDPTPGVGPQWFTTVGNQLIRATGSETTYYLMARIGDLYTQTSIYGCTLLTDEKTCSTDSSGNLVAGAASSVLDDFSRTEFDNGAGVGSGNGIKELCGILPAGGAQVPDFARASRAAKSTENGTLCPSPSAQFTANSHTYSGPANLVYADDAVPPVDFQFYGDSTVTCTATCTATQVGPVASGWIPGNAFAGPYTNNPVTDIDNIPLDNTSPSTSSVLYRLQCGGTGSADPLQNRISDWGQLTDPTVDRSSPSISYVNSSGSTVTIPAGTLTKGQEGIGAPIGVPIYLPFVNTASGTESTWQGLSGCSDVTVNTDKGTVGPGNVVQENDAPQLGDLGLTGGAATAAYLAAAEVASGASSALQTLEGTYFPSGAPAGDNIYQSNFIAATLYYISYGVSNWEPHTLAGMSPLGSGPGQRLTFDFEAISPRDETKSTCTVAANCGLVVNNRQLHNYVNPESLRASTLGFMNWICNIDTGSAAATEHGVDLTTGKNYAQELSSTIGTIFFFPREDCYTAGGASAAGGDASSVLVPTSLTS